MTTLEMRINGSTEFADLPTGLDRPLVLEAMDSPTACTPATVSAVGLLVNLVFLQQVAVWVTEALIGRSSSR